MLAAVTCLLAIAAPAAGQDSEPPLQLERGARVGVMYLLRNELTHYHTGLTVFGNHWKTYEVGWPLRQYVEKLLVDGIAQRGYMPVLIQPSDAAVAERNNWFGEATTFASPGLHKSALAEYRRAADAERLVALIVMIPYAGNTLGEGGSLWDARSWTLPDAISDWGVWSTDKSGRMRAKVFNQSQLMLLDLRDERPKPVKRVFGSRDTSQMRKTDWPDEVKELPPETFGLARPILEGMFDRQIASLFTQLQPAAGT